MTTYTKGQHVVTPHGAGKVVGFERFDEYGMSLPPTDVDPGEGRVLVALVNPSNWLASVLTESLPHYARSELI